MSKYYNKIWLIEKYSQKLRISAHDLLIERGRYRQPKLQVQDRLCTSCKAIDDEVHFVMTWTSQNGFTRELVLQKCSDQCPGSTNMDLYDKYICIITPNSEILCKLTETFLINIVNIRDHL